MSRFEQWTSPSGFVLATIGSAVDPENIWRLFCVARDIGGISAGLASFMLSPSSAELCIQCDIRIGTSA